MSRLYPVPIGAGVVLLLPDYYPEPPERTDERVVRPSRRGRGARRV